MNNQFLWKRSYITLDPHMIDLDLPKCELLCYALITQFSRQQQGRFHGSHAYLAFQVGVSRQAIQQALLKLESKGLIDKLDNCGKTEYMVTSVVDKSQVDLHASTVAFKQVKGASTVAGDASTLAEVTSGLAQTDKHSCTNINKYKNNIKENVRENGGDSHTPPLNSQNEYYNESEQEPIVHPLVPLIVELLPNVIINCDPVLSEREYRQIAEEYDKSSWLRQTFGTLLKIHKNKARILGGDYRDYCENKPAKTQLIDKAAEVRARLISEVENDN